MSRRVIKSSPAGLSFTWRVAAGDAAKPPPLAIEVASSAVVLRWCATCMKGHVEIDKATLSEVMLRLARRGLVDRDIDATGSSYRIYVTAAGDRALARGRDLIHGLGRADERGGQSASRR